MTVAIDISLLTTLEAASRLLWRRLDVEEEQNESEILHGGLIRSRNEERLQPETYAEAVINTPLGITNVIPTEVDTTIISRIRSDGHIVLPPAAETG